MTPEEAVVLRDQMADLLVNGNKSEALRLFHAQLVKMEHLQIDRDAARAAIERTRRTAQAWVDMRPMRPTDAGDALAWAGQKIVDTLNEDQ